MIAGIFHEGSGLGNQLHRYVMTRVLAQDKGYAWGMRHPGNFKGRNFMNLDMGDEVSVTKTFTEKKIVESDIDVRGYDPEINFVLDHTIIDGEFQDERYFSHRLEEIDEWLSVEPLSLPQNLCVINFRGGEYKAIPDLYLEKSYWQIATLSMRRKYPEISFEVHTDDFEEAQRVFPHDPIIQNISLNWRSIRYAQHLIVSNSSFAILPALLNEEVKEVIAPRYWARRNTGIWALPQNYYHKFTYL